MMLTVLGSGTGEPSLARGSPGLLLTVRGRHMLFDSGPGTLRALLAAGVTYRDIDTICYTHLHCDHVAELAPILFAMRNSYSPRLKDLALVGPPGLAGFYRSLLDLYGSTLTPESYRVELREISGGELPLPEGVLAVLPMEHQGCSSAGFRLSAEGKSFAYSGDTGPCPNVIELGRGVDLLALECSAPDGMAAAGHLTPALAGAVASRAKCAKLLLTHLYPVCDGCDILAQCRRVFKGEVLVAADGMRLRVGA